ncbi:MAG: hypothetical protein KA479_09680 [Saprospiraceae bacterium]|nr:hypothetical protein [Saprospiraceae bacterium]
MFYTIGITLFYVCCPLFLIAQASTGKSYVHEALISSNIFDQTYLDTLAQVNPFLLERWSYMAQHGWEIKTFPAQKGEAPYQQLEEGLWNGHNALDLELKGLIQRQPNYRSYYRIGTSNDILILHSSAEITQHMNLNRNFTHPQKSSK